MPRPNTSCCRFNQRNVASPQFVVELFWAARFREVSIADLSQ